MALCWFWCKALAPQQKQQPSASSQGSAGKKGCDCCCSLFLCPCCFSWEGGCRTSSPTPLAGCLLGTGGHRDPQTPSRGDECFACRTGPAPSNPPLPEVSLRSPPSAAASLLAESPETLLPTCTAELSELFKDTRIFLLHSRVTWLANAGRLAAAAGFCRKAAPSPGMGMGIGMGMGMKRAAWKISSWLCSEGTWLLCRGGGGRGHMEVPAAGMQGTPEPRSPSLQFRGTVSFLLLPSWATKV